MKRPRGCAVFCLSGLALVVGLPSVRGRPAVPVLEVLGNLLLERRSILLQLDGALTDVVVGCAFRSHTIPDARL